MPAAERAPRSELTLGKILLSFFILFHVTVLVVMANGTSYLGRSFGTVFGPYSAALGLNTPWNFFSPDPAHTMYLKFTVHYEGEGDDGDTREMEQYYMPKEREQVSGNISERRDLYATRYMILDPRRFDAVLGPWLCRRHQGATVIRIELVVDSVPTLDEASLFSERDLEEMSSRYDYIDKEYHCSQMGDEVAL